MFSILIRDALGIMLVSFTSGMLTARSFAARNRYDIDVNQEFIAIGACNIAAGLGQGFAVILAIVRLLALVSRPHDAILGKEPGVKGFHDVRDYPQARTVPGLLVYRFDAGLVFFNADYFKSRVLMVIAESPTPVRWFVLDAGGINFIDIAAVQKLQGLRGELASRGIVFCIARPKRLMRGTLELGGLVEEIGRDRIFVTVKTALGAYQLERKIQRAAERAGAKDVTPATGADTRQH